MLRLENRNGKSSIRANRFILCMCSPVLHKMLCGGFIESKNQKIDIDDVDGKTFGMVLDMWCGNISCTEMKLGAVIALTSVADRFQMTEVASALKETVQAQLSVHTVVNVLSWSCEFGMRWLEAAAWKLATEQFEQLAKTEGFLWMDEELLEKLLDHDGLITRNEEAVWEAVAGRQSRSIHRCKGWIKTGCKRLLERRRALVRKIRFPLMEEEYLRSWVVGMAPAEDAEWMQGIVAEALEAKAAIESFEFELLEQKALDPRLGLKWQQCEYGGGRRLEGHRDDVITLAHCEGQICSGSLDSSIRVWSKVGVSGSTIWSPRLLVPVGTHDTVFSLSSWKGRLISGHRNGQLRMWNLATGECNQVLEGHTRRVWALAVCGSRLASGSEDKSIKVWAIGDNEQCMCERTLLGHTSWVHSLAAWQNKVLSGSEDKSVRVWDVGTGTHEATLVGHDGGVLGLAVCRNNLFSASRDGTIRVWRLGTWEALQTVEACGRGAYLRCLVVCGSRLFSGSQAYGSQREVRVWDVDTLDLQHTLPMADFNSVWALLGAEGCVWAGVNRFVVVWGQSAHCQSLPMSSNDRWC
jgi:hypothetical protein